jgi:hypothetical protein
LLNDVRKEEWLAYLLGPTLEHYVFQSGLGTKRRLAAVSAAVILLLLLWWMWE